MGRGNATALEQDGDNLIRKGRWERAATVLTEAARELQFAEEQLAQSRVEAKIGQCFVELRKYSKAMDCFKKQLAFASTCSDPGERIEGVRMVVWLTLPLLRRAQECVARHNIGAAHFMLGAYSEAMAELQAASRALEGLEHMDQQIARTESLLGMIHQLTFDFAAALRHHKRDLKVSTNAGDEVGVFRAQMNAGVCHVCLGQREAAHSSFETCISWITKSESRQLDDGALAQALYLAAISSDDPISVDELDRAAALFRAPPTQCALRARPGSLDTTSNTSEGEHPTSWDGHAPKDALVASLIYLERAKRELQQRDENGAPSVNNDLALWFLEAAQSYIMLAQASLVDDEQQSCTSLALVLFSIFIAVGSARAMSGELGPSTASFVRGIAVLDEAETAGCFAGDASGSNGKQAYLAATDGPAEVVLFYQDGPGQGTRRNILRRWRSIATLNQGIAKRAGNGLGQFFSGADKSPKILRDAIELLTAAIELNAKLGDFVASAAVHNHRGCCWQVLGYKANAMADFERQMTATKQLDEPIGLARKMDAFRNLVDLNEMHGDMTMALRYAKEHLKIAEKLADSVAIADSSKRIVALYCAIGDANELEDEGKTFQLESVTIANLETMHPRELDRREEDMRWIVHNAKTLARWYLQRYSSHARVFLASTCSSNFVARDADTESVNRKFSN